jgi:protoporphyrinogen oxidase
MSEKHCDYLVLGAGISGLSFAATLVGASKAAGRAVPSICLVDKENEPGGYCRTVVIDGFVWDFSGHFFHFKHHDIEAWLRARMVDQDIRTITKRSFIRYDGDDIDFPFQKNIHQLKKDAFVDCLYHLFFRPTSPPGGPRSFLDMLYEKFGQGIAERFLVPYNEKLYACDLKTLDVDAMGRFFPHADIVDIVRNMKVQDNQSYNATFTYPRGGAVQYVNAFLSEIPRAALQLSCTVVHIDVDNKVAATADGIAIQYQHLVSSAPLPTLLQMANINHDASVFRYNKVLCFNLGFDTKGPAKAHWMYFPERDVRFYRVGFYDNILDDNRMSLYVEIGARADEQLDIDQERTRVLDDLRKVGIVTTQKLIASHFVVMNPAYVHITEAALAEQRRVLPLLSAKDVYSVGRYGAWTYCSIEDNIVETRALATKLLASTQK